MRPFADLPLILLLAAGISAGNVLHQPKRAKGHNQGAVISQAELPVDCV